MFESVWIIVILCHLPGPFSSLTLSAEANSRHRALLVMEARRTWVEAVSEAMTCDGRRLIQTALELRREVEEELPVEPWRKSLRLA